MKLKKQLINRIILDLETADHSLTHGKSGMLIALCYYFRYDCKDEAKNRIKGVIENCINDLLDTLNDESMNGSLANGVTGISFAFQIARKIGPKNSLIDDSWFSELDDFIKVFLDNQLLVKEYDLLRGANGCVNYLLNYNPDSKYLGLYIDSLFNSAIWDSKFSCHWAFFSFNEQDQILEYNKNYTNMGLAHGMAGVIGILSRIYSLGIKKERVYSLLDGAINYLLKNESKNMVSQFTGILDSRKKIQDVSRLGWCYGDLGVGLSILKAGKASNNIAWQEKGNEICSKTLKRNISNAGLDEHGICHGFLGAMHMYKKVYHITEHPKYLKAIDYWYNLAFEKRDFGIDELGFFQADLLPNGKLHKYTTSGLLLGLSGVYLSLCSQNKSDIDFSWDSAFLLDTYKILG